MKSIIFALFLFFAINLANAQSDDISKKRTISVCGDAEVKVEPDIIVFDVGVETWNKNLRTAKTENDKRVREILSIAKRYSIPDKYLKTECFTINPNYKNDNGEKIKGYHVNNYVQIELRDISKLDSIIIELIDAGLTSISPFNFKSSEFRKHKDEARKLAIRAAKEKASNMAGELGMKLGKPITISEAKSSGNPWFGRAFTANSIYEDKDRNEANEDITKKGQITMNASVEITFEIE